MKNFLPIALLAAVVMLGGCKNPYHACTVAGSDIAKSITAAQPVVDQLHTSGLISTQEDLNVQGYLKFANDADGVFLSCVSGFHTNGGAPGSYTACVSAFSATLNTSSELALVKVTNPKSQATIMGIVDAIAAAASSLSIALGGA